MNITNQSGKENVMSQTTFDLVQGKAEILKRLESDRQYYIDYLELLEKVKYHRKKDGTEFKSINKNFENGRIEIKPYNDSFHPSFVVSGRVSTGKYESFDFDAYLYIDDMRKQNPNDERIQGIENVCGFMRNTYLLTVSEIEAKIESEKVRCRAIIENYNKQIERLDILFESVSIMVENLKTTIFENCKDLREIVCFRTTLEYALRDYIRTNI